MTGVYGHQTRPHNLRHMSIDIEKNIEFLFRNMEDEIKERNRKRAEIWALKSFRDRSYVLMEGELFPMVLSLPTGSLKEFTKYLKRQLSKGRKLNQIVTKISLKKATNSSGIAFSQAVFTFDRVLNEEEKAAIVVMTESVKNYAANLTMSALAEGNDDAPFVDAETGEVIEPLKK